jgi:hypothetical protein
MIRSSQSDLEHCAVGHTHAVAPCCTGEEGQEAVIGSLPGTLDLCHEVPLLLLLSVDKRCDNLVFRRLTPEPVAWHPPDD